MAAHVRTLLAGAALSLPVTGGRCARRGIYLWEYRQAAHRRRVTVTGIGE